MTIFLSCLLILIKIVFVFLIYSEKFLYKKSLSIVYIFFSFSFIYSILPFKTDYTSYQNFLDYITVTIVLVLSSLTGLFYTLSYKVKKLVTKPFLKILLFSALFTFSEILISLSGGLIFLKNNSDIIDYSYFNTGYALSFSFFGKASCFGHVYILTLFLGIIVGLVCEYAPKRNYQILGVLFLCCIVGIKDITLNDVPDNIIIGRENKELNIDNKSKYDYLIYNLKYYENNNVYGITFFENNKTKEIFKIYKYALMPFGEYFPTIFSFLKNINKNGIENFNFKDTVSYNSDNNIIDINKEKYLILICADAWTYRSVSRYKSKHVDYIVIQTNDSVFHSSNFYKANTLLFKKNLSNYFGIDKVIYRN